MGYLVLSFRKETKKILSNDRPLQLRLKCVTYSSVGFESCTDKSSRAPDLRSWNYLVAFGANQQNSIGIESIHCQLRRREEFRNDS